MTRDAASSAAPGPALPHDLSVWGMFLAADWVVQAVMLGLAVASVLTWTILVAKAWELRGSARRQHETAQRLAATASLADLASGATPLDAVAARLLAAAEQELHLSQGLADAGGIKERIASRFERIEAAHARQLRRGTGLLATIGATAPFVGLFGTVWGIMNSFIGIAHARTTQLAVVAPGIAEALLATALGLVAAIPAVVVYNHFARSAAAARARTSDLSAAVQQIVSRDLDRRAAAGPRAATPLQADRPDRGPLQPAAAR
ncbi:tonB-system energizer ExbB [Dokdonella koreensis]|uniref:Biopolymer transport protein ExbB n=1 Tax=Dokdonella koreensis DS-123 TaxID=1300342 RepID=A0A161HIJ3_9GAMM|nr:tonB-system energizer ExbB [Dokdonella koreensis]ANB16190.1 MotA/TolQ/ExbB proton channel [Dokdonella koreensis DS-123]